MNFPLTLLKADLRYRFSIVSQDQYDQESPNFLIKKRKPLHVLSGFFL